MSKNINNLTKNNFIAERTKNINKPNISFNNIKKYNTHKSFSFYNKASTSIISSPKKVIVMKIIKSDSLNQTTKDMDYSDYKEYKENVKDIYHERNLIKNNLLIYRKFKGNRRFLNVNDKKIEAKFKNNYSFNYENIIRNEPNDYDDSFNYSNYTLNNNYNNIKIEDNNNIKINMNNNGGNAHNKMDNSFKNNFKKIMNVNQTAKKEKKVESISKNTLFVHIV